MCLCCINCFEDEYLRDYIKENGAPDRCHFCGKKSKYCIEAKDLEELFQPMIDLYTPIEDFMPGEDLKRWDGEHLWDKIDADWSIFSGDGCNNKEQIVDAIFSGWNYKEGPPMFLESFVESQGEYWGSINEYSDKFQKIWRKFCNDIIENNRYFPKELNVKSLREVLSSVTRKSINPREFFYRSRVSKDGKPIPSLEMGKPPRDKTPNGRANPKGIPYLYLASDIGTAIAEIRPLVKDKVTVAEFIVQSTLIVVDLRNPCIRSPFELGWGLEQAVYCLDSLRLLASELSKPVDPRSSGLEYIPTQFLCEFIKNNDYEGILFKSAIEEGDNLVVFDDKKVECARTYHYSVENVLYKYEKLNKIKNKKQRK
jgi:RES domain-containing protein